jgi:hypothetical protein
MMSETGHGLAMTPAAPDTAESAEHQNVHPVVDRRRGALVGAAAGLLIPLAVIVFKAVSCHYGRDQASDIANAFSMCALPPALAGGVAASLAVGAGDWLGQRRHKGHPSRERTSIAATVGLVIGVIVALVIGLAFGLALLMPDC